MSANDEVILQLLQEQEWSGTQEGPGYGPMDSGPGKQYPACPECKGIKPGITSDFIAGAHGHRANCKIGAMLTGGHEALRRAQETQDLIDAMNEELSAIELDRDQLRKQDQALSARQQIIRAHVRELEQPRRHE